MTGRIVAAHRPYHAQLATLLEVTRARFGIAVLLDLHSMPPIAGSRTRIVIGDRFGRAAGSRFVRRVEEAVGSAGLSHARNAPYAGGHILERHGHPREGIHAIQLEIDRSLYLDPRFDQLGSGFEATVTAVRTVIDDLTDEAASFPSALAAE